jgi:hypothetical protein
MTSQLYLREQLKGNEINGYHEPSLVTTVIQPPAVISSVPVVIPPCRKKFEEIKKSNDEAQAKTSVYTRFAKIQPLPDCYDDGFFKELQCEQQYCWCVNSSGEMIEATKKYMFRNSAQPICQKIERNVVKTPEQNRDGPCWKQATVPGRKKLICDNLGSFMEIQDDPFSGRKNCHDKNSGLRIETLEVTFDASTKSFMCQVKTTTAPPTTTLSPEMIAAKQKLIQQQLQDKLQEKAQELIQSKLQGLGTEMREKVEQVRNMIGSGTTSVNSGYNAGAVNPYQSYGTSTSFGNYGSSYNNPISSNINSNLLSQYYSSQNQVAQQAMSQYKPTSGSYIQNSATNYGARPNTSQYVPNIQQADQIGNPWAALQSYMG